MNLNSYDYIVNADTYTNVLPRDITSYDKEYWQRVWKESKCHIYFCAIYLDCNRCPYA